MKQILPGTSVEIPANQDAAEYLDTLFSAGGLVLSQVLEITGLNTYTIQNWVKRGFLPPPVGKKYGRNQLCGAILLNMLGTVFHLDEVKGMLDYVAAADVGPAALYTAYTDVLQLLPPDAISQATVIDELVGAALAKGNHTGEGAKRLGKVLHIMVLAFLSARLKRRACQRMAALGDPESTTT